MVNGVRYDNIRITHNDPEILPVKGTLSYRIVNKGDTSIMVGTDEIESGDERCYPSIDGRIYCQDQVFAFSDPASANILLERWYPVVCKEEEECKD